MNRRLLYCASLIASIVVLGTPCITEATTKKEAPVQTTKKKKKKKTLTDMDFAELKEAKDARLAKKDKEGAIRYLEKMITVCTDQTELSGILMELADLFFDTGKLVKAEKFYEQFYTLYPGNDNVEKAHYKAILCSFYLTLDSDRDQTKTQETLSLANTFLDRKEIFKTYTQDVSSIQQKCYEKLCTSDLQVAEFYLKRGRTKDLVAAEQRLEGIRKDYLDKVPSLEPRVLALEIDYATKTKDFVAADQKRTLLASKYPENTPTRLAAGSPSKPSFIDRF